MQAFRFAAREAITDATERGWEPGPVVGVVHSARAGRRGDVERLLPAPAPRRVRAKTWVNMMPSTVITNMMRENDFHGPAMSVSAMCASGQRRHDHGQVVARLGHRHRRHPDGHRSVRPPAEPAPVQGPRCGRARRSPVRGLPALPGGEPRLRRRRGRRGHGAVQAADRFLRLGARWGDDHGRLQPGRRGPGPGGDDPMLPSGTGQRRESTPSEVAYVNAHGPGTAACDVAEATMLDELFPEARGIFSVKPLVGHCQAAAAGGRDPGHALRLPDRLYPGPSPGRPGSPQTGQRANSHAYRG